MFLISGDTNRDLDVQRDNWVQVGTPDGASGEFFGLYHSFVEILSTEILGYSFG